MEHRSSPMSELTSTRFLRISRFQCFLPGVITFSMPENAPPLFVGSMSMQKVAGTGVVAGHITEGSETGPGRVNLQVSEDIYNTVVTVFSAAGEHAISIAYDSLTYVPISVRVT
jgi:hypothetical protein